MEIRITTSIKHRLLIFGLVGLGGLVFAGQDALAQQMNEWKLLPRQQGFTELYFTQPRQPIAPRPDLIRHVDFTVRNSEYKPTVYQYKLTVSQGSAGTDSVVGEGSVTLRHGMSQRIQQDIILPQVEGRIAVRATIDYDAIPFGGDVPSRQTQLISYWTTVTSIAENKDAL